MKFKINYINKNHSSTSYTYFGARYYDSELSVWLSVDPMSDKYPSTSAYMYCAGNPVILFDNDGNRIFVIGETSQNYVKSYLNEHFGNSKAFRITYSGELKVNNRRYEKFYNSATDDQKMLMSGLKEAINQKEIAEIYINENSNKFTISQIEIDQDGFSVENYREYTTDRESFIQPPFKTLNNKYYKNYYIFINNERSNNTEYNSFNGEKTGKSASATFFHEILDEFLNYYTKKTINDQSPQIDKVQYQNAALRNLGKTERDGSDHQ